MLVERKKDLGMLQSLLSRHSVVGIIGARQVGEPLWRALAAATKKPVTYYFDLENPQDLTRLSDPMLALKDLKGLVVFDEVQRHPESFRYCECLSTSLIRRQSS